VGDAEEDEYDDKWLGSLAVKKVEDSLMLSAAGISVAADDDNVDDDDMGDVAVENDNSGADERGTG
jgi:uncharacterized protein YfiM (DUF2279 family)